MAVLRVFTKEELAFQAKSRVLAGVNSAYNQMVSLYSQAQLLIFSNPDGLTPQEVLAAFGPDAAELLRISGIVQAAINAATPGKAKELPVVLAPNEDGTVSIVG